MCFLYLVGITAWWGWLFVCLWLAFCLVNYEYLFWANFLLLLPIYFQLPILVLPSLSAFYFALKREPFDKLNDFFRYPAIACLIVASFVALHSSFTIEHDLLLAPLLVCYILFSVSWAMWTRTYSSKFKYLILFFSWIHTSQFITLCFGGPRWFLWLPSTLSYGLVSLILWFLVGLHLRRIHHKSMV